MLQNGTKLTRHIKRVHKKEPRVKEALKMKKKDMLATFISFKREGIYIFNKREAALVKPNYQRERTAVKWNKLLCCGTCKSFVASRGFNRHIKNCQKNHCRKAVSIPISLMEIPKELQFDEDFKLHIISKFRQNEVGKLCQTDSIILQIGSVFYRRIKRKADKAVQVRRTVRIDMRRIAGLYLLFLEENVSEKRYHNLQDMFLRSNFESFRNAIERYSISKEGTLKAGLKQNLLYLLKRSAKILRALMMAKGNDEASREIDTFVQVLELWEDFIFGDAQYELNKRRQIKLRRPESLPNEDDILCIRDRIINTMKELTQDVFMLWDTSKFIQLRDSACTRLTLLNARRGGEPARLSVDEWTDANEDKWIDRQRLGDMDDLDKLIIKSLKVTYLTGKGNNHLVPILIPEDTVAALRKLSDPEVRLQSGVNVENTYLFPSTRESENHVSGWHAMRNICESLTLKDPENLKSTANRHRISTLFAAMDISKSDRQYFYKHMGHSENTNKNIYQAPLALMEITKIGKHLMNIDQGK